MKKAILSHPLFFLALAMPVAMPAQVIFSHAFLQKMAKAHLEILEPVENSFHTLMPKANEYLPYDLVLESEARDLEVRFALRLPDSTGVELPPHAHVMSALMSIGSNAQEETEIRAVPIADRILRERFHADYGARFFFTPKRRFADWNKGEVLALYAEGKGLVLAMFFYEGEAPESPCIWREEKAPGLFFGRMNKN